MGGNLLIVTPAISGIINITNSVIAYGNGSRGKAPEGIDVSGGLTVWPNKFKNLNINIENCMFHSNIAESGASIVLDAVYRDMYFNNFGRSSENLLWVCIKGCTFQNSSAVSDGGALYIHYTVGIDVCYNNIVEVSIQQTNFSYNSAGYSGGAIVVQMTQSVLTYQRQRQYCKIHTVYKLQFQDINLVHNTASRGAAFSLLTHIIGNPSTSGTSSPSPPL